MAAWTRIKYAVFVPLSPASTFRKIVRKYRNYAETGKFCSSAAWLGLGGARLLVVGWQVTLCDPIWQVTSHSSEMGFPRRAISAFTFTFWLKIPWPVENSGPEWITLPSAKALIQLPRASNERLMLAPSRNLAPRFVVTVALSEPARSIRDSLPTLTLVVVLAVRSWYFTYTCTLHTEPNRIE